MHAPPAAQASCWRLRRVPLTWRGTACAKAAPHTHNHGRSGRSERGPASRRATACLQHGSRTCAGLAAGRRSVRRCAGLARGRRLTEHAQQQLLRQSQQRASCGGGCFRVARPVAPRLRLLDVLLLLLGGRRRQEALGGLGRLLQSSRGAVGSSSLMMHPWLRDPACPQLPSPSQHRLRPRLQRRLLIPRAAGPPCHSHRFQVRGPGARAHGRGAWPLPPRHLTCKFVDPPVASGSQAGIVTRLSCIIAPGCGPSGAGIVCSGARRSVHSVPAASQLSELSVALKADPWCAGCSSASQGLTQPLAAKGEGSPTPALRMAGSAIFV